MLSGRTNRTSGTLVALVALGLMLGCATTGTPPASDEVRVLFTVKAPGAASVTVVGSFNQWNPERHLLSGPDQEGGWEATLSLRPGRYEYLFLINGASWVLDASAPFVEDGMGGRNSVVIVRPE